jgi:hypothetical protein
MYTPVCQRLCSQRSPTDVSRDVCSALDISGVLWFCNTMLSRVPMQGRPTNEDRLTTPMQRGPMLGNVPH